MDRITSSFSLSHGRMVTGEVSNPTSCHCGAAGTIMARHSSPPTLIAALVQQKSNLGSLPLVTESRLRLLGCLKLYGPKPSMDASLMWNFCLDVLYRLLKTFRFNLGVNQKESKRLRCPWQNQKTQFLL
jgi:hypothetical protein